MINKVFSSARRVTESVMLPITPMASIFTVILVLLLKTAVIGVTSITPNPQTQLPQLEVPEILPRAQGGSHAQWHPS